LIISYFNVYIITKTLINLFQQFIIKPVFKYIKSSLFISIITLHKNSSSLLYLILSF
jgi:hypothetical protein